MAAPDSDEDESYVEIGTELEVPGEDEPRRKKIHVEDLPVKDSRGRTRFHGAFTGGFSAGYFNTAGSKEGWTPSTFTSSRSSRAEKSGNRPEDFMDEDDLGEHGIAPRRFTARDSFSHNRDTKKRSVPSSSDVDILSADFILSDLVLPEVPPAGIRLLRKMGWRDGQGIGPRHKKKLKKKVSEERVFGCSLPPTGSDSEVSEGEADLLKNFTFAPKDVTPVDFTPKDNTHGIGYRGLNPKQALQTGHFNLFESETKVSRKGKRGMKGQAFGVGALEDDDDDDVYGVDHLSNYHSTLSAPGEEDGDGLFGWTAPKGRQQPAIAPGISGLTQTMEGFPLSSVTLAPSKVYPPPRLPPSYTPYHIEKGDTPVASAPGKGSLNFISRGLLLGEKPSITAMANLKMQEETTIQRGDNQIAKQTSPTFIKPSDGKVETVIKTTTPSAVTPSPISQSLQSRGSGNVYKPFAKDPAKQRRYEQYTTNLRHSKSDPYSDVTSEEMTEWEKDHEKEEFSRASHLYKPLSAAMASRFTTAKYTDDSTDVTMATHGQPNAKSDGVKAAEMKMFGRLTRELLEWHPDNTLCKRFNVPNPYPGSQIVGLPGSKRRGYSVFDLLDVSLPSSESTANSEESKPLAIEAKKEKTAAPITVKSTRPRLTTANIFAAYFEDEDRKMKGLKDDKAIVANPDKTTVPSVPDQPVTNLTGQEKKKDDQVNAETRPPMDLFKAIFQDSDSDSSSEDEASIEPVIKSNNYQTPSAPSFPPANGEELPPPSSSTRLRPYTSELGDHLEEISRPPAEISEPSSELFGPSLPPVLTPSSSQSVSQENVRVSLLDLVSSVSHHKKKKHKGKDKKKKKDKDREKSKNKHKKKKR